MRIRNLAPQSPSPEDLLAAVARARGAATPSEIRAFLDPLPPIENALARHPEYVAARERIARALSANEGIVLYGDYDCDGITSLVQMHDLLRAAGHKALEWFVPDRQRHDYGLTRAGLEASIGRNIGSLFAPKLLIALDCGSSAVEAVAWLRGHDIDVILVDHHAVPEGAAVRNAAAHLNPKVWRARASAARLEGAGAVDAARAQNEAGVLETGGAESLDACALDDLSDMSAAGLALLVSDALARDLPVPGWDRARALTLAGLGTVVDVMPLRRSNRAIVKHAVALANQPASLAKIPGLQALAEVTRTTRVDASVFGFRWGPRLNANGRLDDASQPIDLLLAENLDDARAYAERCHRSNDERRELQDGVDEAAERLAAERLRIAPTEKVLLLCDAAWHPGVVGIVASRLRERYQRPAIVCGWHEEGYWKGSGRSCEAFDLGDAVGRAREAGLLLGGGGHRMAAGVKIAPERVESFREWLTASCRSTLEDFVPVHEVLAPVDALHGQDAAALAGAWCDLLARLEPFGAGNPQPGLLLRRAQLGSGPREKRRSSDNQVWAQSAGFRWSGRGFLFADWTNPRRAREIWEPGGCYDLVLGVSRRQGIDHRSGRPTVWNDWRVIDCERVE